MKSTKIFLAVIFIMAISFGVKAQDKYEYSIVAYIPKVSGNKADITISTNGKFTKNEVAISDNSSAIQNFTPIIEVINKMATEGWEVYGNNAMGFGLIYYFLRKKKS